MRQQPTEAKFQKSFIILAAPLGALIVVVGLMLGGLSKPIPVATEGESILAVQADLHAASEGVDSGSAVSTRR